MKALLTGLTLLAAMTGFSLLPREPSGHTPYVVAPGPAVPAPEWSIQPIPTDGWEDPLESPRDHH